MQLSSLAEQGDLEGIKSYLYTASSKIPDMNMHFCDNRAADSIISYYYSIAVIDSYIVSDCNIFIISVVKLTI